MNRKEFISTGGILGTFALAQGCSHREKTGAREPLQDEISDIPIFCSHEHWGSIDSIGHNNDGFKADIRPGALPERMTTIIDLLLDPYLGGNLVGKGFKLQDIKTQQDPVEAFQSLMHHLKDFRLKGTFLSLRLGIDLAYNYDILTFDPVLLKQADSRIGENYQGLFVWYHELMKKAALSDLIRPVQPEYYFGDFSTAPAQEELAYTSTVLRIDPFLDFWKEKNTRRDNLALQLDIDPTDASSWRDFLEKVFSHSKDLGCIGIKQLQAYSRNLEFEIVKESEVRFRGKLSETEVKKFQDWVMHTCCQLANQQKWPHQIHVGTHNLPFSNPLPLARLASLYPDQKIVMLHCWPYLDEAGFLAQTYPNVYIDTCWQPILNPDFLRQSLDNWLSYIPLNKITMSNDSTSVEMAVGASIITRKVLSAALSKLKSSAGLTDPEVREIGLKLFHNNAVKIYEKGELLII